MRTWEGSSGHRRNLLLPTVNAAGVAMAQAESGRAYWTLVLGTEYVLVSITQHQKLLCASVPAPSVRSKSRRLCSCMAAACARASARCWRQIS